MSTPQRFASAKSVLAELAVISFCCIASFAQQVFDGPVTTHNGYLYMTTDDSTCCAPEVHFKALNGSWLMGMDVRNPPQAQDFVAVAKIQYCVPGSQNQCSPVKTETYSQYSVDDLIYVHNGGSNPPTVGIGVTPPNESHRLQVTAQDNFPSMGILQLRRGPQQTGNVLTVIDSNGNTRWYVDNQYNTYTSSNFYAAGNIAAGGNVNSNGNLTVFGSLSVSGAGELKIDHPLDPANKYLSHASVQSSDMMDIYSGNVALNQSGEADVSLPEWFEAMNRDFRYQLTCIGASAPVYIAQEVLSNHFRIAGGTSGLKVSWQVTATRNDPYAQAHRSPVEQEKPLAERGHYLHPELFGASSTRIASATSTFAGSVKR